MATEFARLQILSGNANGYAASPGFVPLLGEWCLETDTGIIKLGDGITAYSALNDLSATVQAGIAFASQAEVEAGTVANKPIAPAIAAVSLARVTAAASNQTVENNWTFNAPVTCNNTLGIQTPTLGTHATTKDYIDNKFSSTTSGGAADSGKAPALNSAGQIDGSFLSISGSDYKGQFDPVTPSPPLENVAGGGTPVASVNGDFYVVAIPGGGATADYDFGTATPGSGTTLSNGDICRWNTSTNVWDVTASSPVVDDPNAIKRQPNSAPQSTIQPTAAIPALVLQRRSIGATESILRIEDEGGVLLNGFNSSGQLLNTGPIRFNVNQVGHGFLTSDIGKPLKISGAGVWSDASADASANLAVGVLAEVPDVDNLVIAQAGELTGIDPSVNGGSTLTTGAAYFLSDINPGEITTSPPSVAQVCLIATGTASGIVQMDRSGAVASPINLLSTETTQIPLTIVDIPGQTGDSFRVRTTSGVEQISWNSNAEKLAIPSNTAQVEVGPGSGTSLRMGPIDAGTNQCILYQRSSVNRFQVARSDGSVRNESGTYSTTSSYRIKRDIQRLDGRGKVLEMNSEEIPDTGAPHKKSDGRGLREILKIDPISYHLRSGEDKELLGFIAEEVEKVLPELSDGEAVNLTGFIPVLVQAIKDLNNRIDSLSGVGKIRGT